MGGAVGNLRMERVGQSQLPGPHRGLVQGPGPQGSVRLGAEDVSPFAGDGDKHVMSWAVSGVFSLNCACDLMKFVTSLPPFCR